MLTPKREKQNIERLENQLKEEPNDYVGLILLAHELGVATITADGRKVLGFDYENEFERKVFDFFTARSGNA
ncbi:hypothetical protein OAU47_03790 [Pelagibacterales bacterium]|nr:hypothetical protein [Pelagibacterales bacterium]